VASLLLARGEARRGELAVRAALGATRLRLVRQVLTETCLLSSVGALAGLPLALAVLWAVRLLDPRSLPRVQDATLDGPVLAATTAVALWAGLLFGLVPALQMSRVGVGEVLGEAPRGGIGGRRRVRRALVAVQVATAVVLLVGAGLLVKSFVRLLAVPTGIDATGVLTLRVTAPEAGYPGRPEVTAFFARLADGLRSLPGVQAAGAASGLPLAVPTGDWNFEVEGRPATPGNRLAADWFAVTPGYFEALGVPLHEGRRPDASDTEGGPPVLFFNESAARRVFPGESPVGRRVRLARSAGDEQPWRTIAGVVADVRHRRRDAPPRPEMYIPHAQFQHFSRGVQARTLSVVVKASRPPGGLVEEARAVLRGVDPSVPASQVRVMEDVVASSVSARRRDVWLMGAFAAIALVLAAIGVYGVTAWDASQRIREFGIRMALGATPADVRRLVLGQGLLPVDVGLVAGIGAAGLLAGGVRSMLFDVQPRDLTVFAAIAGLLFLVSAAACLIPALKATRRGPAGALREE
jgi:putative ABC transport system permease protein